MARSEPRQPPFAAADLQDPPAVEVRNVGDRSRLNALGIAHLHTEDDTAISPGRTGSVELRLA